jgi:hypothetical protein
MPGERRKANIHRLQGTRENMPAVAAMQPHPITRPCAVAIVVLIVASASIPGTTKHLLLGGFPSYLHLDKVGHLLGFGALGFAFIRARFAGVRPWHILAFAFALGCFTEIWQRYIPGRTSKLGDVLIDLAGACVGVYVAARAWSGSTAERSD